MEHLSGRSVSRRTYEVHGCRCDGCCAAKKADSDLSNPLRKLRDKRREDIEIGVARGLTVTQIMRRAGCDYVTYRKVRDAMDRLAT
jgi:hypothetical protein